VGDARTDEVAKQVRYGRQRKVGLNEESLMGSKRKGEKAQP